MLQAEHSQSNALGNSYFNSKTSLIGGRGLTGHWPLKRSGTQPWVKAHGRCPNGTGRTRAAGHDGQGDGGRGRDSAGTERLGDPCRSGAHFRGQSWRQEQQQPKKPPQGKILLSVSQSLPLWTRLLPPPTRGAGENLPMPISLTPNTKPRPVKAPPLSIGYALFCKSSKFSCASDPGRSWSTLLSLGLEVRKVGGGGIV